MSTMKKITAVLLCLCTLLSLCACSSKKRPSDPLYYFTDRQAAGYFADASEPIAELNGFTKEKASGKLTLLKRSSNENTEKIKLFNLEDGKVVFSAELENKENLTTKIDIYSASATDFFTVTRLENDVVFEIVLYDESGKQIASTDKNAPPQLWAASSFVFFDGNLYEAKAGELIFTVKTDEFNLLKKSTGKLGDYYVVESVADGVGAVTVVDNRGEMISSYTIKSQYIDNGGSYAHFPLCNGNIVFMYRELLPDNAKKYDVITLQADGEATVEKKSNVHTEIFDIKSGEVKEADLDYVIVDIVNGEFRDDANVFEVFKISKKRFEADSSVIFTDNDLKIKAEMSDAFDGIDTKMAVLLYGDVYLAGCTDGFYRIVNEDGEIIKIITEASVSAMQSTLMGKYFFTDEGIYNVMTFGLALDLTVNDRAVLYQAEDFFIISERITENGKAVTSYLKYDGTLTKIMSEDEAGKMFCKYTEGLNCYCIRELLANGKYTYDFYNQKGVLVLSVESELSSVSITLTASYMGNFLLSVNGEHFYLR